MPESLIYNPFRIQEVKDNRDIIIPTHEEYVRMGKKEGFLGDHVRYAMITPRIRGDDSSQFRKEQEDVSNFTLALSAEDLGKTFGKWAGRVTNTGYKDDGKYSERNYLKILDMGGGLGLSFKKPLEYLFYRSGEDFLFKCHEFTLEEIKGFLKGIDKSENSLGRLLKN